MARSEPPAASETQRIGDRLHWVHLIKDDRGKVVTAVTGPLEVEFRVTDFLQLTLGACVMALPMALTGEVWDLGAVLSVGRTLMILAVSILTLAAVIWGLFYGKRILEFRNHFLRRVVSAYLITFLISLVLLFLFDKAPFDDLRLTLTRTIIVAFPASFAATAVDFIH